MKATDLMIGDWVLMRGTPVQVRAIGVNTIRFSDMLIAEPLENIEPIPLTPKILEKNGFKYSNWYGWQIKEPDFTLCFVGDTPHFLLDDIFVCDCPYVHTLQHALRLCGIEKEIVL